MSAATTQVTPVTDSARLLRLVGYSLSLVCLVWVLHDIQFGRLLHDLSNVNWKWVVLGIVFDVLSYVIQAIRWKFLLAPFGPVRVGRSTRAVFAGLFANLVFPLRPGELLRAYLVADTEKIKFGRVMGSVGVERLVDLVIATSSLAIAALFVDLPNKFKRVADTMGVVALILLAIVVALIFYLEIRMGTDETCDPRKAHLSNKMMAALMALHAMGTSPSFYPAVLFSMVMPMLQVLGLWSMMNAYGLGLPFLSALVVLLVINIGVSLPNAPANVGSYQFFCVLGLSIFQIEKTKAAGFSIFAFLAMTLPFLVLGFAAVLRSGMSVSSMREQVIRIPKARQADECQKIFKIPAAQ